MLVEGSESVLGKCGRRAQLAGTERRQRLARRLDIFRGRRKTLGQRQQAIEAHALDLKARSGRSTARILKHRRDEPIIAGRKVTCHVWCPLTSTWVPIPAACGRPWRR